MGKFDDKLCANCHYNLLAHRRDRVGRCPECGQVFNAYTGEGLVHPDDAVPPGWLGTLQRHRTKCLAVSAALCLLGGIGLSWFLHAAAPNQTFPAFWAWGAAMACLLTVATIASHIFD